jgi:hypothetical protein
MKQGANRIKAIVSYLRTFYHINLDNNPMDIQVIDSTLIRLQPPFNATKN